MFEIEGEPTHETLPQVGDIREEAIKEKIEEKIEQKQLKEKLENQTEIKENETGIDNETGSYTPIIKSLGNILGEIFCPKFKFDDDEVRQIDENLTVIFGKTSSRLMAVLSIILILASKYLACVKLWRETKAKMQNTLNGIKTKIYGDGT